MWAVDTACIVPMRLSPKAHARAYTYRSQSEKPLQHRLRHMPYQAAATDWKGLLQGWQHAEEVWGHCLL